ETSEQLDAQWFRSAIRRHASRSPMKHPDRRAHGVSRADRDRHTGARLVAFPRRYAYANNNLRKVKSRARNTRGDHRAQPSDLLAAETPRRSARSRDNSTPRRKASSRRSP